MTKLEQLKKEIQRLRPEIMELKFGCEVEYICESSGHNQEKCLVVEGVDSFEQLTILTSDYPITVKLENIEILGRPITLEDVLAVLDKIYKNRIRLCSCGEFLMYEKQDLIDNVWVWEETEIYWLLGNPLDSQSEETINFLHNLICNK